MGSKGPSGSTVSETRQTLAPEIAGPLSAGYKAAQDLWSGSGGDPRKLGAYPVDFSPETTDALSKMAARARQGSPFLSGTDDALSRILAGGSFGDLANGKTSGTPGLDLLGKEAGGDFSGNSGMQWLSDFAKGAFSNSPGLAQLQKIAQGETASSPGYDAIAKVMRGDFSGSPGLSGIARTGAGDFSGNAGLSGLARTAAGDFGGAPGYSGLVDTASGKYLPGLDATGNATGNPFLANIMKFAGDQAQSRLGSAYAGAGRYGSGDFSAALGDSIASTTANLYGTEYDRERALQQQAQGSLAGAQSGAQGTIAGAQGNAQQLLAATQGEAARDMASGQMSAAGALGNAQLGAISGLADRQNGAATTLANAILGARGSVDANTRAGLGMIPGMTAARQSLDYTDLSKLGSVGSMYDQRGQQVQDSDFNSVSNYLRLLGQGPGMGGLSSTQSPYFSNPFGSALSGALGLGALGNMTGAFGGKGGGSGWLSGMFGSGGGGANLMAAGGGSGMEGVGGLGAGGGDMLGGLLGAGGGSALGAGGGALSAEELAGFIASNPEILALVA